MIQPIMISQYTLLHNLVENEVFTIRTFSYTNPTSSTTYIDAVLHDCAIYFADLLITPRTIELVCSSSLARQQGVYDPAQHPEVIVRPVIDINLIQQAIL